LADEIAACGATVVTHPRFLEEFGRKYREEVSAAEREWLYPLRMLRRAGVPIAFGSDAPICTPEPLKNLRAAVLRGATAKVGALGESQAVSIADALDFHTRAGSLAGGYPDGGRIEPGSLADLVLLDRDPTVGVAGEIVETQVLATVVGGAIGWCR
jgi:predicted amidohydrolase YtcJ